jgi:hypothetical protein
MDPSTGNTWELGPARARAATSMSRGRLTINGGETAINVVVLLEVPSPLRRDSPINDGLKNNNWGLMGGSG